MEGVAWFLLVLHWLICGFLAKHTAQLKGYKGWDAFGVGFLFGPLGLLAVVGMPDRILRQQILGLTKALLSQDTHQ